MKEQLGWLARNVHVWPAHTPYVIAAGDAVFKYGATFYDDFADIYGEFAGCGAAVHKQQWLDRRAELQNKPSWKDAPEWATHLAQQVDGDWMWCGGAPVASKDGGWFGCFSRAAGGETLGDWRDTLERRPSEQAATGMLAAGKTRWDGESGPRVVQAGTSTQAVAEFEPFTSVEDAQPAHTIHHAAFLHQGCQLLLSEPELVVFRTADGELIHCKPKECLIDPDVYGLAARLLADMSGRPVAPEHMRELAEQMGWSV